MLDLWKIYCLFVYKLNGIKNKIFILLYFWDKKKNNNKIFSKNINFYLILEKIFDMLIIYIIKIFIKLGINLVWRGM